MKIDEPISSDKIPYSRGEWRGKSEYDVLAEKILALPSGKSLPIVCVNTREKINIYNAIRRRVKGVVIVMRGLTIYASND